MSFVDLFKKKSLRIFQDAGVTKQDVSELSKTSAGVEFWAMKTAETGQQLEKYYAEHTWAGDNQKVNRMWQEVESSLRSLAHAVKKQKGIKGK